MVVCPENIRHVTFPENLVRYLAGNVGSLFSANNISKYLKLQKDGYFSTTDPQLSQSIKQFLFCLQGRTGGSGRVKGKCDLPAHGSTRILKYTLETQAIRKLITLNDTILGENKGGILYKNLIDFLSMEE